MPPTSAPATTSAQALQNLQGFTSNMQSPEAELQKEESGLGVQADQQQVTGLQGAIQNSTNLLNQVAPSVMGRTANSLVTSAQADHQISNEQAPINTQLNQENQDYNTANSNYTNALGQAQSLATADTQGEQNQQSYLQNIYNNLYSQEQNTAAQAEQQRMDNNTIADSTASRAATAANTGVGTPSLVGTTPSASTPTNSAAPPPDLAKGTNPQSAVAQLFKGYQPAQDKNYTENTVIPTLARLLQLNNPTEPNSVIQSAAQQLAYSYRKSTFGE